MEEQVKKPGKGDVINTSIEKIVIDALTEKYPDG